jgi:flagellar hook protein FlgE
MMASLYSGVSGLQNHQVRMNVIGNNIANVNTIGFKGGRVTFREALVQDFRGAGRPTDLTGGTNPIQLGLGMQVSTVDNLFRQGGLETTGQVTDLAIQGSGFFVLSDNSGVFYSRAGSFNFDANATLVEPASGLFVQGRMANSDGTIPVSNPIGRITVPFGQQDPARATTEVSFGNNLDSMATDSVASLVSGGTTGISTVIGSAVNGAGGVHTLTITGAQATNSTFTGANVANDGTGAPGITLSNNMTLSSLGVTDASGFQLSRDNGLRVDTVSGLTVSSTVGDLINAINQIADVRAELVGGEIQISRVRAGSGLDYNIQSSAAAVTLDPVGGFATGGNIIGVILGVANGATFTANSGTNHTFACGDIFVPTGEVAQASESLAIDVDDNTGLAMGILGLGKGGVEVSTMNGLAAGTASITTEDTLHGASITVYDSQGGKHSLTIEFLKSVNTNEWNWTASFSGIETIVSGGMGRVRFNPDGSLLEFNYDGGASSLTFNPNNGAAASNVAIDAGMAGGFDGLTGFASPNTASLLQQDGYTVGILDKISIDQGGTIYGIFTNGINRALAQILLADFNNVGGLLKAGSSLYQSSANSGAAMVGVAGETISGSISSGALESSSVDISQEFTSMITAQRGFQANARIITTSDSMLDELVNLKR